MSVNVRNDTHSGETTCEARVIGETTCEARVIGETTCETRVIGETTCETRVIGETTCKARMSGEKTCEARVSGEATCEAQVSGTSETKNLEISSGEFHGVTNRPQKPRQNEKKSLRFDPIFGERWLSLVLKFDSEHVLQWLTLQWNS